MTLIRFPEIVEHLEQLKEERGVNKRCKEKLGEMITLLQSNSQLVIEKTLLMLEELNAFEMSSYHRTQLWEVASMLESVPTH